jgi:hypothetical protein
MKRDLIDAELFFERAKNPDERLADGSGAHHVNDFFLRHFSYLLLR